MIKLSIISGLSEEDPIWHWFCIVDAKLEKMGISSWHDVQRCTPWADLIDSLWETIGKSISSESLNNYVILLRNKKENVLAEIILDMQDNKVSTDSIIKTLLWIFVNLRLLLKEDKRKHRSLDDEWFVDLEPNRQPKNWI